MSNGSDAADQMTRQAIQISESAVKLTALGAKNLAALCLALAKENQKLAGKSNMTRLLREGKELRVFDVKERDLATFSKAAKQYGVLFSTIKDSRDELGNVDVLARADDVSKINRILERMDYAAPVQEQEGEGDPAKKAAPRARPESKSAERGIGSMPNAPTLRTGPKSVKETIESIKIRQEKPHSQPVLSSKER